MTETPNQNTHHPSAPAAGPWTAEVLAAVQTLLSGSHAEESERDEDDAAATGATLRVTDPDGTLVYTAPLARMWRLDPDDPTVLWLRPIAGRATPPDGDTELTPTFSLSAARRRSIAADTVHLSADGDTATPMITVEQRTGQRATITVAAGDELAELAAWDTFTLTVLSAADEAALEELAEDSCHGPHA